MTDFTGKLIANTYKDILTINSSATNEGLDNTLRRVQDGEGTNSSLKLSETSAAFTGNVSVNGSLTINGAFQPQNLQTSAVRATTVSATNITTDVLTAGTLTFQDVSVSTLRAGTVSATTINAGSTLTVGGDNVITSAVAVSTAAILRAQIATTIANTSAALQNNIDVVSVGLSATNTQTQINATQINNLSTSIAANASAITVNESAITSVNTRINAVSVLAETKASAATSATLETRIASTSAALTSNINTVSAALSIANVSIAANSSAIAALQALTYASVGTSATLETRINSVSVLAETKASAATSATLETRIAAVSSTMATSIGNSNSAITALSATMATSIGNSNSAIATLSATMATSIANYLPLAGGTLTGDLVLNADPSANLQAASKQYVDNLTASSIHVHEAVRVETNTTNLNATYNNGSSGVGATLTNAGTQAALVVDGVTVNTSDRVLVLGQTNQTQNGIYVVTNTGSGSTNWILTRSDDADTSGDGSPDTLDEGSYFFVQEGTVGAAHAFVCNTQGTIVFGTTNITFAQFSDSVEYTAGTGININSSRVVSTSGVPTDAELAAVSATLESRIAGVSAIVPTSLTELGISDGSAGQFLQTNGSSVFTFASVAGGGGGISTLTAGTNIALTENGTTVTNATASATVNVVGVASVGTSATLQTKINAVSATMATSIGNSNSAITALSATMATSIGTKVSKAGDTMTGDLLMDSANSEINIKSGVTGTTGRVNWTFDTTSTNYASLMLPYDTRATLGFHMDVGYPITIDATTKIDFSIAGSNKARIESDGDLHVDGNVIAYSTTISDKRLKKDIFSIDNALWKVSQLNGCTFTYLKDDRKSAGLIAQDLEKVLPSAVIEDKAVFHGEEGETYKTVQYDQVIGLLVEAVKELTAKVEELENASTK